MEQRTRSTQCDLPLQLSQKLLNDCETQLWRISAPLYFVSGSLKEGED